MSNAYNDPNLRTLTIDDFTPGVYSFGRGSYNYSSGATPSPPGAASQSYRCYAKKGVGLIPFPRYTLIYQPSANLTASGALGMGGMRCVMVNGLPSPNNLLPDILAFNFSAQPTASGPFVQTFSLNYLFTTTLNTISPGTAYTHSAAFNTITADPALGGSWPGVLDTAFFQYGSPAQPVRSVFCVDPTQYLQGQLTWVMYPAWNGTNLSGNLTLNPSLYFFPTSKVFYVNSRACFTFMGMVANPIAGFNNYSADAIFCTDVQAMTVTNSNTFNPNYYYPELGVDLGSWGSVSDGEFWYVFRGGGGVVIYGDIDAPTSAIKLPGIVGTGSSIGAATETDSGMLYVTDTDGVYLWNGGNTSQKISSQVFDDQFYRATYPGYTNVHNDIWGHWYMAANNWMWDTETGSWWQVEDPNIVNFQMHCQSVASLNNFYSADGYATFAAAGTARLNIWSWLRNVPQHNYTWTSTAIAEPGQLVDIAWVEICASNASPTPCTVVVQPTSLLVPGQSGTTVGAPNLGILGPPVTFTIPPNTLGYRESARMGYSDYNLTVKITANNPSSAVNAPAPTVHELSIGFSTTRPSGALQ